MLISKKGYYFLKAILFFAFSKKRSFSIKEISERLDISGKVLEHVLLSLKNKGILSSKRGPQGGYTLDAEVVGLTLADIFDMAGQKIEVLPAESGRRGHMIDEVLMSVELSLEKDIVTRFGKLKIKDLVKLMKEKIGEKGLSYVI